MKIGYFTAIHGSSLEDCLETEKRISEEVAVKLIEAGIYKFYAFDDRIRASRFLLCDIPNNLGLPQWINRYE